ncbi:hypothetical protein RND81_10G100100 [Saponaria officinalis]
MQSQVLNQNQSVPLQMAPNQSQARQQLLTHNIPINMVSGALQTGVTLPANGLAQNPMPNVPQNSNVQNTSSISQNSMGNTMNPGIVSSMFSNAQRQLQGRQQHIGSQQQHQQSQNSQQFMYQQQQQQLQLKHQLMQHNLQQQNIQQPLMQTQQQQQQTMQTSSVMQPSITGLQQNQQASIQQPTQSVLQQHQQSMIRQQSQQTPAIQQQQVLGQQLNAGNMQQSQLIGQQPNYGSMQKTQLIGQQPNVSNTQQSQLIGQQPNAGNKQQSQLIGQQPTVGNLQQSQLTGQQSNILDMQQQQQQQRLLGQQNNVQNLAPQQLTSNILDMQLQQQQRLLGQQNNIQNLAPQQPSNFDSGQASAPSSMQQGAASSMQINTVSAPHQANSGAMQPQGGVSLLHQNVNNIHTNTNMLQNQHLKQQHEQQNSKQHILNKMQLQKQQILQQQLNQQGQQPSQMQAHQMAQLQQLNDVNEKMRHLKSGAFAQHLSSAQRFMNHQVKPGASFPVSSPQLLNAVSPQINHHSSPQIDPQNLPPSVSKGGTPLHSVNSPFVPSPSTPLVPSPMPGDHEKPAVSSLSNAANVGQQTNGAIAAPQSLSIGTPGISPSPLFECAGPDGTLGNASATISGKSSVTELPIERLLRAVKSASPKALTAAISDISSVVSMVDCIAGSAPGNGSRATVGEDLVAMTKCRLQARNILTQDGSSGAKRMRRYTSAMPLHVGASAGSGNDSLKQLNGPITPELESTATSGVKKARIEVNHALLEEIREINERLIDTVVSISDEDMSPSMAALAVEGSEGIVVKCSYNAITLSPSFRSQFISAEMSPIQPLKLLVPDAYPNCSPILLYKLPIGVSNEHEDLSVKAKSRFSVSPRSLSQPMPMKDIARTWDDSARAVISEYAQRFGGGTFSSKYGTWENCLSAA